MDTAGRTWRRKRTPISRGRPPIRCGGVRAATRWCAWTARGSGKSPGQSDPSSYAEAVDFYDAIEWIAKLPWCSGNIGTLGVSYHANCQWRVANLQPPSLKAIIPWEGRADLYRDQTFHGGIFAMGFLHTWIATNMAHHLIGRARTYNPGAFNNNMLWKWACNSLDSEFWRMRSAQWDKITVPLYSVGNWTGAGLHLRGNVEGFVNAASKHKKLRIHSGTHFHPVPLRGRAARPAALLRPLAEGQGHRDHGRAAGEAHDTHGRRRSRRATSSASRTSGRSRARAGRSCISRPTAAEQNARRDRRASSCAAQPPEAATVHATRRARPRTPA